MTGGAERRLLTVIFCDLVGSSALAAQLDPEEFAAMLVAYRDRCVAAVTRYGGYVVRYAGDGVLACFGYPRAVDRDAQAAVACGLAIAREVHELARSTPLPKNMELAVRIGIETGIVLAGRLGSDHALEIDGLVGTAPNIAARLQELAAPNGVIIGEATHELVADEFACEEIPLQRLTRLQPSVRAFAVRQPAIANSGQLVLARPRRAPFVGRANELKALSKLWKIAAEGHGQTALVSGEAGVGKSRLAQELLNSIMGVPHALVVLACTPPTATTAFYPAIEALRHALTVGAEGNGPTHTPVQALAEIVEAIGLNDGHTLLVLQEALGIGPGPADLAPAARRRLLLQTLQAWLLHHAHGQPLLILAEDLHWADPSLLELLHSITELISNRPVMLLATYRSNFVLPWPDRPTTFRLTLSALERSDSARLLDALLRDRAVAAREMILARSDGVPLFLEEFARAAVVTTVPRTLQQLFTARLDSLGDAKRLAQCAAIIDPYLEPDLLAALAEVPDTILERWLSRLIDAEILVRVTALPAPAYGFRHALLQQAASESILLANRRALHARAANLLAVMRPGLVERRPEVVAEHHFLGENYSAALPLYFSAGRRALAAAALEEAESQVRRGLQAVQALPAMQAPEAELDLRVLMGQILIARRGYANAAVQEVFEAALKITERVPTQARTLPAFQGLASFYQVRGPLSRAEAICGTLVTMAEHTGDDRMLVDAWRRRGWNRACMGRLIEAEEDLERALAAIDPARQEQYIAVSGQDPRVLALANLCWLDAPRRGIEAAARRARAAAEAARASPHPVSACYGFVLPAFALQRAGQLNKALQLARRALAVAAEKGFAYWVALSEVAIGYDQVARARNAAAGREKIRRGLASYRETQGELLRPLILSLLAEAEIALGEVDAAEAAMREAADVALALEAYGFLPELLLQHARLIAPDATTDRRDLLNRALTAAREQRADAVAIAAAAALASLN
jgi:class 3 adenylate cyclase/tetratricopeptide (TPR) repeat protein